MTDWIDAVGRALHPLDAPPGSRGWNHEDVTGLIGDRPRMDAAVLMAIRAVPEPGVVFTLRRNDLSRHAGQVSFPGGRADRDDPDAVATALRESHEEIALDPMLAEPLGYLDRVDTISGFCVTPVVARLAPEAVLVAQPDEVASVFEVPLTFLLDPANLRRYPFSAGGPRHDVYEYTGAEPRIWGATAAMLVNLLQRMGRMP